MTKLTTQSLKSFKSALKKLTGYRKRIFAAELSKEYFDSSPRKTESYLGVKRTMVEKGLKELETGIAYKDRYQERGRKKTEKIHTKLLNDIEEITNREGQADPKFQTTLIYIKISARNIREELINKKNYSKNDFSQGTLNNVLNRNGYKLKKVQKSKPLKKNT